MKYVPFAGWLLFPLALTVVAGEPERVATGSGDYWLIAKYDVDGDNIISMDEISHKRNKMFGYMDADEDGQVSLIEYQDLDLRKRAPLLKARFDSLDLDHDGQLDAAEYASYFGSFQKFDRDGDGRLTAGEMDLSAAQAEASRASDTHCLLWFCVKTTLD